MPKTIEDIHKTCTYLELYKDALRLQNLTVSSHINWIGDVFEIVISANDVVATFANTSNKHMLEPWSVTKRFSAESASDAEVSRIVEEATNFVHNEIPSPEDRASQAMIRYLHKLIDNLPVSYHNEIIANVAEHIAELLREQAKRLADNALTYHPRTRSAPEPYPVSAPEPEVDLEVDPEDGSDDDIRTFPF